MKPLIVLAMALLSGSIPLAAQQVSGGNTTSLSPVGKVPKNSTAPSTVTIFAQQATNCPAMFSARHLSDGSVIRTGSSHPKGIGQWLHITLNSHQGAIATFAIHGFSNKARMTETSLGSSPDAVQTVTEYLAPAQGQAEGSIWAPELTAVTSIDLISLKYDDGTKWDAQDGHACRVTPDPMMLVTAR